MINYLFDLIEDHLKEAAVFQYISHDFGQLTGFGRPPVRFPAAIYDVTAIEYTNQGYGVQTGAVTLTIKIAHKAVNRSSESQIADKAKEIFNFLAAAHAKLQLASSDYITPLMRQRLRKLTLDNDMVGYELTYRCSFADDGGYIPTYKVENVELVPEKI